MFHSCTNHIEAHYHFMHEQVLSREVELVYVLTDRETADIFTKPLGLDKLRQFSGALGLQHLDMPNLWGRSESRSESEKDDIRKAEPDVEFDFGMAGKAEDVSDERTGRRMAKY